MNIDSCSIVVWVSKVARLRHEAPRLKVFMKALGSESLCGNVQSATRTQLNLSLAQCSTVSSSFTFSALHISWLVLRKQTCRVIDLTLFGAYSYSIWRKQSHTYFVFYTIENNLGLGFGLFFLVELQKARRILRITNKRKYWLRFKFPKYFTLVVLLHEQMAEVMKMLVNSVKSIAIGTESNQCCLRSRLH